MTGQEDEDEDVTSYVLGTRLSVTLNAFRLHNTREAHALVIHFSHVETQTRGE